MGHAEASQSDPDKSDVGEEEEKESSSGGEQESSPEEEEEGDSSEASVLGASGRRSASDSESG